MSERHATVIDTTHAADVGPLPADVATEHTVQFYENEAFLHETVARFVGAGLVAGDAVIVVNTQPHSRALFESLESKGIAVERALSSGRLTVLDAEETLAKFLVGGVPDYERFAACIGPLIERSSEGGKKRVRVFGEMVDVLWRRGNPHGAIQLEEAWNELGKRLQFSLLCAYVMGNFFKETDSDAFRRVCETHHHAFPAESYPADADEATRLREISMLQQRARALETELRRRRELEEELRYARERAEAASSAKDEFLAMLGHELRNPLSPIVTALELVKLRGDGRSSRELDVIERQTRHLIRLVDDLLDVSRITRGKVELRKSAIEIRDVLAKATEIASPLLEERRHHFRVDAPPRGLLLQADEARLAQVVANLLTNAAKYTDPGGHVVLSARRQGDEAVIEVRDDGIGIAPTLLPRIFDLFVQGRQSSDRAEGGLGIGLALVRNLVSMHGGTVEAHSDGVGKGSTFVVRLPALDSAPAQGKRRSTADGPGRSAHGAARRILVVDDNADARELLTEILQRAGHEVRAADSGPAALAMLHHFVPEIAILDVGLPAMDGYELGARLRADLGPRAPALVALTGYGQEGDRARSKSAGFNAHLVKPLEASELLATIDACAVRASKDA